MTKGLKNIIPMRLGHAIKALNISEMVQTVDNFIVAPMGIIRQYIILYGITNFFPNR